MQKGEDSTIKKTPTVLEILSGFQLNSIRSLTDSGAGVTQDDLLPFSSVSITSETSNAQTLQ